MPDVRLLAPPLLRDLGAEFQEEDREVSQARRQYCYNHDRTRSSGPSVLRLDLK